MTPAASFLAHFAFAQMLMLGILLAPRCRTNRSVCLFSSLMICGCGYLIDVLTGTLTRMGPLWWLHHVASDALAEVFWLVSLSVFSERSDIRPWQYVLASLTLLIPLTATALQQLVGVNLREFNGWSGLVSYAAIALELGLIAHAIVIAVVHWRSDLVQQRRYMRGGVIVMAAAYLLLVILIEQLFNMEWTGLASLKYAGLTLLMLGIYKSIFAVRQDGLFAERIGRAGDDHSAKDPYASELGKIKDSMTVERLYRQDDLTISKLAQYLSIREYKLRQLINGEMGFRNFNDFLNHYRIEEVAAKLKDPEHQNDKVLFLALDSGFRSLSAFNRAFRSTHGMTPTEYRNRPRYLRD